MDGFKVFDKPCDECLFGPNKVVSDKRKANIIEDCRARDSHFVCHKATINGDEDICCRSWFERFSTNLERVCGRLGMLFFVDLDAYLKGETKTRKPEPGELTGVFSTKGRV